jgi:predicted RNase H-like HicB family nuclease
MARKASAVIEKDEHGYYAWHPELKGCQSQGASLEGALANIREAIELYLETLPPEERDDLLSQEILTTAIEVNAKTSPVGGCGSVTRPPGSWLSALAVKRMPPHLFDRRAPYRVALRFGRRTSSEDHSAGPPFSRRDPRISWQTDGKAFTLSRLAQCNLAMARGIHPDVTPFGGARL